MNILWSRKFDITIHLTLGLLFIAQLIWIIFSIEMFKPSWCMSQVGMIMSLRKQPLIRSMAAEVSKLFHIQNISSLCFPSFSNTYLEMQLPIIGKRSMVTISYFGVVFIYRINTLILIPLPYQAWVSLLNLFCAICKYHTFSIFLSYSLISHAWIKSIIICQSYKSTYFMPEISQSVLIPCLK